MGTNYYLKRIPTQEEIEKAKKLLDEGKIESQSSYFGYNPEYDMAAEDVIAEMTKEIHIGKSSYGWQFVFRTNNEYYPSTYKDVINFIKESIESGKWKFIDEYGSNISIEDFENTVSSHKDGYNYITYNKKAHLMQYSSNDFIAEDNSWWCSVDFC